MDNWMDDVITFRSSNVDNIISYRVEYYNATMKLYLASEGI